ncbi:hypothetical protein GDO86_016640, partial [Hymenochirus boettgeri]
HMLHYYQTMTSHVTPNLPQCTITAYVDGLQFGRYSSDTHRVQCLIPSLNSLSCHLKELTRQAQILESYMRCINHTSVNVTLHVYQMKFACKLHENGTIDAYGEFAMDNQEVIIFDRENGVYVNVTQNAQCKTTLWNTLCALNANQTKLYMEDQCIQHLKMYLPLLAMDLNRKGNTQYCNDVFVV